MISRKWWLVLVLSAMASANGHGRWSSDDETVRLINEFDACIQTRFQTLPSTARAAANLPGRPAFPLGMSRAAVPSSFGRHYLPDSYLDARFPAADRARKELRRSS